MLSCWAVTAGPFEMAQSHRAMCLMVYCHNDKGERKSGPPEHRIYLYQRQFFSIFILGAKTATPTTTTTTKQTPSTSISSIQVDCWHFTSLELSDFLGMGPDPFGEVCRDTKVYIYAITTCKLMEHYSLKILIISALSQWDQHQGRQSLLLTNGKDPQQLR